MSQQIINLLLQGFLETVQMTVISTVVAVLLGVPLGVILVITSRGHIMQNEAVNKVLGAIVNATRSIPFIILMVAIKEVNGGVIEAAQSMGATPLQIIWKVLLPEALPTLIDNITVLIVNLISYSAMAGAIGGGGLGDIAIRYGYQRFQGDVMLATIIILIVLVQVIQSAGDYLSRKVNKK